MISFINSLIVFSQNGAAKILTQNGISAQVLILFLEKTNFENRQLLEEARFLEKSNDGLPDFTIYLKIKYKLPHQAIRDLEIAKEIVEKKYKR